MEYEDYGRTLRHVMDVYWSKVREEERDKEEHMDIQRRVQGQVEIPGVNIHPERVGHDDRKRAADHIRDMETRGYITPEEADKRIEYAAAAEGRAELRHLTADLPPRVHNQGYWADWDWDKPKYFIPGLLAGIFGGACAIVIPGVILAELQEFNTALGQAVFIPLLALGIIVLITSIVLLVIKSSE